MPARQTGVYLIPAQLTDPPVTLEDHPSGEVLVRQFAHPSPSGRLILVRLASFGAEFPVEPVGGRQFFPAIPTLAVETLRKPIGLEGCRGAPGGAVQLVRSGAAKLYRASRAELHLVGSRFAAFHRAVHRAIRVTQCRCRFPATSTTLLKRTGSRHVPGGVVPDRARTGTVLPAVAPRNELSTTRDTRFLSGQTARRRVTPRRTRLALPARHTHTTHDAGRVIHSHSSKWSAPENRRWRVCRGDFSFARN